MAASSYSASAEIQSGYAKLGIEAKKWEEDVNDIVDLVRVTDSIVSSALSDYAAPPNDSEIRQIFFCIGALRKSIEGFNETFYAALSAR